MARAATDRIKMNPPLGRMPVLQNLLPAELQIDASYQRSLDASNSQSLIRRMAQHWNWDLCQPLVVARRDTGDLFVIDGQHRLAAARLRGDIAQLPAVVLNYASPADEAASFVHLNQQRRPLGKLDVFKAALASGDRESVRIHAAIIAAGLSVAPHSNYACWKPGMVQNIGGIENAWRVKGPAATTDALKILAEAFAGQVLRYAGTLFPGIAGVVGDEKARPGGLTTARRERLITMLALRSQTLWRGDMMAKRAEQPDLKYAAASVVILRNAWAKATADGAQALLPRAASVPAARTASAPVASSFEGKRWCTQCEMQVSQAEATSCRSRFCAVG